MSCLNNTNKFRKKPTTKQFSHKRSDALLIIEFTRRQKYRPDEAEIRAGRTHTEPFLHEKYAFSSDSRDAKLLQRLKHSGVSSFLGSVFVLLPQYLIRTFFLSSTGYTDCCSSLNATSAILPSTCFFPVRVVSPVQLPLLPTST